MVVDLACLACMAGFHKVLFSTWPYIFGRNCTYRWLDPGMAQIMDCLKNSVSPCRRYDWSRVSQGTYRTEVLHLGK